MNRRRRRAKNIHYEHDHGKEYNPVRARAMAQARIHLISILSPFTAKLTLPPLG